MSSTLLYLAHYIHVSWTTLMSGDPMMNTFEPTFLLFFSISLAMTYTMLLLNVLAM